MRGAIPLLTIGLAACTSSTDPAADAGPSAPDTGPIVTAPDAGATRPDAGPPLPRFDGLPTSCWLPPNSSCNPANNDGCAADEACDVAAEPPTGRPIVMCFPPPAEQELGESCANDTGPYCRGGLRCMDGACMDTCCTDAECSGDERCVPLDATLGTLGVCDDDEAPTCEGPGGFCAGNGDCCSGICHSGHCH